MSLIGKNTLSYRKKDVLEQKLGGSPHKRLVWAHKATAGETGINLTALTTPTEMSALGFTNPNTSELLAGKMLFYKKNLTVTSSSKGILMQDLSYTVPTNERIAFQGFTADEDEIFTCTLESEVKDGYQVVDATAIVSTGVLSASTTTFNVGTPFQVGKYISTQAGSVLVYLDGVQQFRNTNNSGITLDANYYEVDAGGGLGNIIEFNSSVGSDRSVLVVSNGMVAERPNGSTMAVVESLAGQIDLMIPTLAATAGVPETTFQGAPNNVDLKSFGDKVQDHEVRLVDSLGETTFIKDVKADGVDGGTFTSGAWQTRDLNTLTGSTSFATVVSDQFILQPGTYNIEASAPAYILNNHQARIYNITDTAIVGLGTICQNPGGTNATSVSHVMGTVTISVATTFELQHRCGTTKATDGFGGAGSFGSGEVYSQVKITKVGV